MKDGLNTIDGHLGVETWPKGPSVEDAIDGQRGRVLDAAGQIAFAGYGNDQVRALFDDNTSGYGSPRGNRQIHTEFGGELQEVLDGALAAALAVFNPVGDLHRALLILQAMRHEKEDTARGMAVPTLGHHQFVVDGHKGALNLFAAKPRQFPHLNEDREQGFCRKAAELPGKRHITAQQCDDDQQGEGNQDRYPQEAHEKSHDPGKAGIYAAEAVVRDNIEESQKKNEQYRSQRQKGHKGRFTMAVDGRCVLC